MFLRTATTALILLLAVAAAAHDHGHHDTIDGSGKLETRSFDLDGFTGYEMNGSLDTRIRVGGDHQVTITLDDNLFDNLEIEVEGGTLVVEWDESCDPHRKAVVEITMPKLESLELNGAGDLDVDRFRGDELDILLRGAGDLEVEGEVDRLDVTVMGVGDVKCRGLEARHVKAVLTGVGDVEVTAKDSFEGTVSGVGDIEYWGNPEKEKVRVSGIGDIERK